MRAKTFQEQVAFTPTGLSTARWGGLKWVKGVIHTIPALKTARADASRLMIAASGRSEVEWRQGRHRVRREIEPGAVTFISSGVELEQVRSLGDYESFGIEFDPAKIDQWTERGVTKEALKISQLPRHIVDHDMHLLHLATAIEQEGRHGCRTGLLYAESICLTLLSYVWGKYSAARPLALSSGLSQARVKEVKAFVWEHMGDDLSLDQLANLAGLSVSHFCSSFKRATGVSPYRYLLDSRIERSKELLRSTSRSVTDVALATGFASASHFGTSFKKATSVTPSQYRMLY